MSPNLVDHPDLKEPHVLAFVKCHLYRELEKRLSRFKRVGAYLEAATASTDTTHELAGASTSRASLRQRTNRQVINSSP